MIPAAFQANAIAIDVGRVVDKDSMYQDVWHILQSFGAPNFKSPCTAKCLSRVALETVLALHWMTSKYNNICLALRVLIIPLDSDG